MSVQAFSWVIERSQHGGSPLLVMLMIANHSHSDGAGAYPSLETLSSECRMSKRGVQYVIERTLVPSLELLVRKRVRVEDGYLGRHEYVIPGVLRDGFHLLGAKIAPRTKADLNAKSADLSAKSVILGATVIATEPRTVSKPKNPPTPLVPRGEQSFLWTGQQIIVDMGRRRRLPSLDWATGALANEVVDFLNRKGYPARIAGAA